MSLSVIRLSVCIIVSLHILPNAASATTIRVPADQPTIQAGIDAASESDTVLVAPGTYTGPGNRSIGFGGKNLVLRSENGPEATIIDAEWEDRVFYFRDGEGFHSRVDGFTIQGGYAVVGAGIYLSHSAPRFFRCYIQDNYAAGTCDEIDCTYQAPGVGGGVSCESSAEPLFMECVFARNGAADGGEDEEPPEPGSGGALYCDENSEIILFHCTFSNNWASSGSAITLAPNSVAKIYNSIIVFQGGGNGLLGVRVPSYS